MSTNQIAHMYFRRLSKLISSKKFFLNALRISNISFLSSILIALLSKPLTLFTGHPLLMCLCWICACEGLICFKQQTRSKSIDRHTLILSLLCCFCFAGVSLVYINKQTANRLHFQTYHAFLGLILSLWIIGQSFGSAIIRFQFKGISRAFWKIHKFSGILVMIGLWIVSFLHLIPKSGWYVNNSMDWGKFGGISSFCCSGIALLVVYFVKK